MSIWRRSLGAVAVALTAAVIAAAQPAAAEDLSDMPGAADAAAFEEAATILGEALRAAPDLTVTPERVDEAVALLAAADASLGRSPDPAALEGTCGYNVIPVDCLMKWISDSQTITNVYTDFFTPQVTNCAQTTDLGCMATILVISLLLTPYATQQVLLGIASDTQNYVFNSGTGMYYFLVCLAYGTAGLPCRPATV